jgi:hypothetical protein
VEASPQKLDSWDLGLGHFDEDQLVLLEEDLEEDPVEGAQVELGSLQQGQQASG